MSSNHNVGDRPHSSDGQYPNGTRFHPSGEVMPRGPTAEQKLAAERARAIEWLFNGGGGDRAYLGLEVSHEHER
jgi:hypothetical protein